MRDPSSTAILTKTYRTYKTPKNSSQKPYSEYDLSLVAEILVAAEKEAQQEVDTHIGDGQVHN
jgi:hypothetical protein